MNDLSGKSLRSEFVSLLERFFVLNQSRILEVGTGTGAFSIELALRGAHVVGMDIAPSSVELASRISADYHIENVKFTVGDGFQLLKMFKPQEFDIAFNIGVLEHFEDEDIVRMLKQMGEVAKFVVVGVPYSGSQAYKLAKDTSQKLGTWEYGFERDFWTLEPLIKRAGLIPLYEEVIGVLVEPNYLRRVNPSEVPVKTAENLHRFFQGDRVGCWLICIATKWESCADDFAKLENRERIRFEGTKTSLVTVPEPLVSIVIPVLNGAGYVKRTVENLKGIKYDNLEIVLVDDGSTDGTAEFFEGLIKAEPALRDKVSIIKNEENIGTFHSRLVGTRHSKGEFVFFQDIDDIVHPEGISRLTVDFTNFPKSKPLLTVSCALMENGSFNGEVWASNFYRTIGEILVSEVVSLSGKVSIINTLIERERLLSVYQELDKIFNSVGVRRMTIAEDSILSDYLLLKSVVKRNIPVFYTFLGYERSNVHTSSKRILGRVQQIPIHTAFLMIMMERERLLDKNSLNQLDAIIKQNASKIYGQELGRKFYENYLDFKGRFAEILL